MRILSVKLFDGKVQTFQPEFTIFGGAAIGDLQVEFPQERGGRKLLHFLPAAVNGKGCYGKNERLAVLLLQQLFTKLLPYIHSKGLGLELCYDSDKRSGVIQAVIGDHIPDGGGKGAADGAAFSRGGLRIGRGGILDAAGAQQQNSKQQKQSFFDVVHGHSLLFGSLKN